MHMQYREVPNLGADAAEYPKIMLSWPASQQWFCPVGAEEITPPVPVDEWSALPGTFRIYLQDGRTFDLEGAMRDYYRIYASRWGHFEDEFTFKHSLAGLIGPEPNEWTHPALRDINTERPTEAEPVPA